MRSLRVLLVPSAYYPHVGGIEELTRQLALALKARGHDPTILTNRWPSGVGQSDVLDGIAVTRLAFPLPTARPVAAAGFVATAPASATRALRHISRVAPDVVHVIGGGPQSVYLASLRRLFRARLVFTAQGEVTFDANGIFARSITMRAGLRRMLLEADAVTACSAFAMRELAAIGKIRNAPYVIPNGVNPKDFADAGEIQALEAPYVLAVGRLVQQKGFDILLEAIASDRLDGQNLVIAGDGQERATLIARAGELGIASRVRFLGSVNREQVAQLHRGALAFAFPSRGEPFGIALLEAMAAGVPAVAVAAGGVPEFAVDGENAVLVPPDDPYALAAGLARIMNDENLQAHLIKGGRRTAAELNWESIAERYEDIYIGAVSGERT